MSETPAARRLPKRDLWLLPLIAFATLILLSATAEVSARVIWPEREITSCMRRDADGVIRALPNCRNMMKTAEGPWVLNRYNECGLRATGPCLGFDPRYTRIVVIGSSTSWGYLVPFDQVWSTRLAHDLSHRCNGRPFDVQSFPSFADINGNALRLDDVLRLQPDMVVMVISPLDLESISARGFVPPVARQAGVRKVADTPENLIGWLRDTLAESRAAKIAQHFLYRNPSTYVPAFLTNGDKADFLREPLSPAWRHRVQAVSDALHYYQQQFRAKGVPLMLLYAPQQAQAQLLSDHDLHFNNVDPTELPNALRAAAQAQGVLFADASRQFEAISDPENMYYNADGHLNGDGHALLAEAAVTTLTAEQGAAPLCPPDLRAER